MAAIPLTLVHQLNAQAERLRDRPALWHRRGGQWESTSWRQYAQRVRQQALGLMSLGFGRGQALVVSASNREEWLVTTLSAMAVGGAVVAVDPTSEPEALREICGHSEATVVVLENPAMWDRLSPALATLPRVGQVILMDAVPQRTRGVRSLAEVREAGSHGDDADFYASLAARTAQEVAQLVYGAAPTPRAAMLTHRNLCWTGAQLALSVPASEADVLLSSLPLDRLAEQLAAIHMPLWSGAQVYFGQGAERVPEDLLAVRPTIFFGVPRVWETLEARAQALLTTQRGPSRRLVARARPLARRFHAEAQTHQPSAVGLQGQFALARRLVLGPLKERLGLDRGRVFITAAPPDRRELLEFFASLDVIIKESYGRAEATGLTSISTARAMKSGTQGRPMLGVEVRVAEDGEVLVRGENVCAGYLKDARATAELLVDGWLHTGDLGTLDEEGFLSITGRKSRTS
jgi:long-chain acyl-CoA synthetase